MVIRQNYRYFSPAGLEIIAGYSEKVNIYDIFLVYYGFICFSNCTTNKQVFNLVSTCSQTDFYDIYKEY